MSPYDHEVRRLAKRVSAGAPLYEECSESEYVTDPDLFCECMKHTGFPEEFAARAEDDLEGEEMFAVTPSICFFSLVCDVHEELEEVSL